jgi:hypothetical protein
MGAVDGGADVNQDNSGNIQRNSSDLLVGDLTILDWNECKELQVYDRNNILVYGVGLDEKMICAVTDKTSAENNGTNRIFSCRGDSGGPVIEEIWQDESDGRQKLVGKRQVGIVSWAYGCGSKDEENEIENPSVFVDVAQYVTWINSAKKRFVSGEVRTVP